MNWSPEKPGAVHRCDDVQPGGGIMKRKNVGTELLRVLSFVLVLGIYHSTLANELVNGGFEGGAPVIGLPDQVAIWGGDYTSIVVSGNGIAPLEGDRMLSFDNTFWGNDGAGPAHSSDIWQLVDAESLRGESVVLRAYFNRVAGDDFTDTQFYLAVHAFVGNIDAFDDHDPLIPPSIETENADVLTDADPGSWEEVIVAFDVPENADYLGISASAFENIQNDTSGPEFDGHYVDNITLELDESSGAPPGETMASRIVLHEPYPNPFNPRTTVSFSVERAVAIRLSVFDIAGRLVRMLHDGEIVQPGRNDMVWPGIDNNGRRVCSGLYFIHLETDDQRVTKRMVLIE